MRIRPTTLRDRFVYVTTWMRFECKIWFYAILHVTPIHWFDYRREVRRIEKQVRDELLKLLFEQHVIPFDEQGLDLIADRIADTLRRNLPD